MLQVLAEEFRRLDVTGEGRLTAASLRTALQLREVTVDEATVRRWMKETDRGGKVRGPCSARS